MTIERLALGSVAASSVCRVSKVCAGLRGGRSRFRCSFLRGLAPSLAQRATTRVATRFTHWVHAHTYQHTPHCSPTSNVAEEAALGGDSPSLGQRATTPSTRPAALPFLLRSVIGLRSSSMGTSSRGSTSCALPIKSSALSLSESYTSIRRASQPLTKLSWLDDQRRGSHCGLRFRLTTSLLASWTLLIASSLRT